MAKQKRKYKRRKQSWGSHHQSNRDKVRAIYGGLEQDVQSLFFKLDNHTLSHVLWEYEQKYGRGARDYAARTFTKWRSRRVDMSGLILERLIHIVPPHLSFEQKFEILIKAATQTKSIVMVTLPVTSTLEESIQALSDSVRNALWNDLPSNLQTRLSWLAQDDFQMAKILLREAIRHEAVTASEYLKENINNFSKVANSVSDSSNIYAEFEIYLLGTDIQVTLTNSKIESKINNTRKDIKPMSENGNNNPKGKELAKPVENPNNLLNEALQRMPESKAQEIMGKAADEALRLQVKRRESEDDVNIINEKLRSAARFSDDMEHNQSSDYNVSQTHHSEHGDARITVSRKIEAKSESRKFCFVATACFGNVDHPVVSDLRVFRDEKLVQYYWGRSFISWYYENGEGLASIVSKTPGARRVLRPVLWLLARITQLRS